MHQSKHQRLKELILRFSYQKREIKLASGKMSNFYFDGKQTTLHPEGASLVGDIMFEKIRDHFPAAQAIGGPTLGADPIATSITVMSFRKGFPLSSFIVRKAPKGHGTMKYLEGTRHLKPGMRVVLVEDVITSGGSLLKAWKHVQQAGLVSLGVIVLVDREEGGAEALATHGLKLVSLFKKSDLI